MRSALFGLVLWAGFAVVSAGGCEPRADRGGLAAAGTGPSGCRPRGAGRNGRQNHAGGGCSWRLRWRQGWQTNRLLRLSYRPAGEPMVAGRPGRYAAAGSRRDLQRQHAGRRPAGPGHRGPGVRQRQDLEGSLPSRRLDVLRPTTAADRATGRSGGEVHSRTATIRRVPALGRNRGLSDWRITQCRITPPGDTKQCLAVVATRRTSTGCRDAHISRGEGHPARPQAGTASDAAGRRGRRHTDGPAADRGGVSTFADERGGRGAAGLVLPSPLGCP